MSGYKTITREGKSRPAHDVLIEEILGRPLADNEVVHHIDGNKNNNDPENLQVMDRAEHTRLHQSGVVRAPETLEKLRKVNSGRPSPGRKLGEEQVKEIARKLVAGVTLKELSEEYKVSNRAIMSIRDGKTYRDCLKEYPDSAFPLCLPNRRFTKGKSESRKLTEESVNAIRLALWSGEAVEVIAKRYRVSPRVISMIRDGEIYRDIRWPEEIVHMRRVNNIAEMVKIFLSEPMSTIQDEYTALKEDYRLKPDLYAVTILRLVRRALMGDSELAVLLMALGGYKEEMDEIITANSVIMQTMRENSEILEKTTGNADCT